MTCRRFRRLAALAAGSDLRGRELARYRDHASECDACHAADLALRDLLETLRSIPVPEFSRAEMAEVRANVWQAIRRGNATAASPAVWFQSIRLAPVAALAVAALFAVLVRTRHEPARIGSAAPPSMSVANRPSITPALSLLASAPGVRRSPAPRVAEAKRRRLAPDAASGGAPARLEIATPDPHVRIIWLFRSGNPAEDAPPDTNGAEEVS